MSKEQFYIRIDSDLKAWIQEQAATSEPKASESAFANYALSQYRKYCNIIADFKRSKEASNDKNV